MGFTIKDLRKSDQSNNPPPPLIIKLKVGKNPNSEFIEIPCVVDTGLTIAMIALPRELTDRLGIEAVGEVPAVTAERSDGNYPVGECAIIFQNMGLVVRCMLNSPVPLIGLPFLNMTSLYLEGGEIKHLELIDKKLNEIAPYDSTADAAQPANPPAKVPVG